LALAADAKEAIRTEGVGVGSLWITVTARGEWGLALAINTLVSRGAQAIWVVRGGVAVTALL